MKPSELLTAASRSVLVPQLRDAGFIGGPRSFARRYPDVWLSLALNTMSAPDFISFTGDIGVSSRLLLRFRRIDPTRPPLRRYWQHEQRLGSLVAGFDTWWTIESAKPIGEAERSVADFADTFLEKALPALSPVLTDAGLLSFWRGDFERLSPPELGLLWDMERALGVELTRHAPRS